MPTKLRYRHRDSMSDSLLPEDTSDITLNGSRNSARSKDSTSQEKRCGSHDSHSDFYSGLSGDECGYKRAEYQALYESSDESLPGRGTASTSDISPDRKETSYATMRLNESDQSDDSQAVHPTGGAGFKCSRSAALHILSEVTIRVALCASFIHMERVTPFKRIVHPEEQWLYKNPVSREYISATAILTSVVFGPIILILLVLIVNRNKQDASRASWAFTLAITLNGFLTSLLKITVGRPRPDFYYRCYPDGATGGDFMNCTGDVRSVNEGRKSFPSGHASMAFAGFGFMFFYLASRLHIFNARGRGNSLRLVVSIAPLVAALVVAISRTCDYRHHWQDVSFGSILGITVSYFCYRQYFPSIFAINCHRSYSKSPRIIRNQVGIDGPLNGPSGSGENSPLIDTDRGNKWI